MSASHSAVLVLEDGRVFRGRSVGAAGERLGEVIFNTSMTGYQEIASDPSYCGQIVCLTAPQIGNYGVCADDAQAERPALSGLVVRELSAPSSWRSSGSLQGWLTEHGVPAVDGVDTRALTRHLRERGAMRAGLFAGAGAPEAELVERVRRSPGMEGRDLTGEVSTAAPYELVPEGGARRRVALLDFGVKRGILRELTSRGIGVRVLPARASVEEVRACHPDGLVLSNGPGDPAAVGSAIALARELLGQLPVLGICLGHQILGLATGGRTYKLPFGHHGGNHPVRDRQTGELWITAQNHGFAVDPTSLPAEAEITHESLYDGTLEGFQLPARRAMAVQFHPEASPGPSDARPVFDRFCAWLEEPR
jgi:carbamoyl-phosphate synthase small subunit